MYEDALNVLLAESKLGCHIGGEPVNNFSYANYLATVAPAARALNAMLSICSDFAENNYLEFSASKSVVLVIVPPSISIPIKPNVYLENSVLSYVDHFEYLGHILSSDLSDDANIDRDRGGVLLPEEICLHIGFTFVQMT